MQQAKKRGRQQSIPPEHWATVFRLYGEGNGYRRIADLLIPFHVSTTKSSVERLIKGLPPYQGRRVAHLRGEPRGSSAGNLCSVSHKLESGPPRP